MTPEYIELCRRLNLPREWQSGDLYASGHFLDSWPVGVVRSAAFLPPDAYWLPREGDILDLLEAEGIGLVEVARVDADGYRVSRELKAKENDLAPWTATGPDRCTALLRLYEAVALAAPVRPAGSGSEPKDTPLPS